MAAAVACALATQLAAGAVIDGTATAEVRAAGVQTGDELDVLAPLQAVPALQTTPAVLAALESEGKAASLGYALQLSGIPAPASVALFHRGEAAFELAATPLLRTRGRMTVQGGSLDPLQAQLTLIDTGRVRLDEAALPYFAAGAALAADLRLTRRAQLDAGVDATTTNIGGDATRAMHTGSLRLGGGLAVTRDDDAHVGVAAHLAQRGATGDAEHDAAPGVTARLDWTHALWRETGVGIGGGAMALAMLHAGDLRATALRPVGDVRLFGTWDLGGARALGGDARVGLDVAPNPLGGIAESRLNATASIGATVAPGMAVGVNASGFAPGRVIGGAPLDLPPTGQAGLRGSWSITDNVRVDGAIVMTGVAPPTGAMVEGVIATLGVSGTAELWHTGGRPRGTDQRAGRDLGVQRIGAAPPPGTRVRAPEPPPAQAIEVPAPPPPELAPPPVQQPVIAPPPPAPIRMPRLKPKRPRPAALDPGVPGEDDGDAASEESDTATDEGEPRATP
ncbi:MAG: hypothetical protein A2138_09635 [Deltaproteobacteria bacterium RBG_16_71_12]|nr:MAG: hypothetical protein A2138_09635 [Deltaproteobacteria bacterium RBG_16_71_12]